MACLLLRLCSSSSFFFNDTATTEIYTLSLHDALPIFDQVRPRETLARNNARGRNGRLRQELAADTTKHTISKSPDRRQVLRSGLPWRVESYASPPPRSPEA